MTKEADTFVELADRAYLDFNDVNDFIWKTPRFIESEFDSELEKLDAYFPLKGNHTADKQNASLRHIRWALEGRKLTSIFPYLMATGNLFTCTSLYETYCLALCKKMEVNTGILISSVSGYGISRLHKYIQKAGVSVERLGLFQQVSVAFKIRNCLIHASGTLDWSREQIELQRIVSDGLYLSAEHRLRRHNLGQPFDDVTIENGPFGGRLEISNNYAFITSGYLRDHFCQLCKQAQATFSQVARSSA